MSTLLHLSDLSVERDGRAIIKGVSLTVSPGECIGLIGPNGAGKTTLLRAALGLLPHRGRTSLAALTPAERAKRVAFLPQGRQIAWPLPVADLVALGRAPHGDARPDHPAVIRALAEMELAALAKRPATALSGGEQSRALIARALAQETPLLLADEPIAGLDPAAQIRSMALFRALADQGRAVVVSIHDLGLAARHCTRLVLLEDGRIRADGPPMDVLTPGLLDQVFAIRAHIQSGADGLIFQPLSVLR